MTEIHSKQSAASEIEIPDTFQTIPVPLPPMLLKMAGYNGHARFIGLNYYGSKATWHDGRALATFSYYSVYAPFIDHPAIAYVLRGKRADLGSDDSEATHALILDRETNSIFLAPHAAANRFLTAQHPPVAPVEMTPEIWAEVEEKLTAGMKDLGNMQMLGMFEMFGANESRQAETQNLINWLNAHTSAEVREYFAGFGINF